MRRIVLTGATSMLGIALIKECIRNGTHIVAIVRPNSTHIQRLPTSELVEILEGDLCTLSTIEYGRTGFDAFYHFAWQGTDRKGRLDADIQMENVRYTLDAVKLASKLGCSTFIGAGSQAEYGRADSTLTWDTPVNPEIAYGIAKYSASRLSAVKSKELGIRHIWARVLSVYGPYDGEHTMIMSGIRQLLKNERPQYTKGEQLWDYLFCSDAAKAFYLMGEKPKDQAVYCLGSGKSRPLHEFVTMMRDTINSNLEIGIGELEYPPNQVMRLCADISNLTRDTGFEPKIDFQEGIKTTIQWYRETMSQ